MPMPKGFKHSAETIQIIRESSLGSKNHAFGKPFSEEHKRKIGEANKGKTKPPRSEEHKRKLSESQKGKHPSEETLKKMSEVQKGKKHSESTRKKMSTSHMGHSTSEETRRKITEANMGRFVSKETRKKMSEGRLKNPIRYWLGKKRVDMVGDFNPSKRTEIRMKLSKIKKGKSFSGVSFDSTGFKHTEETRRKMSKSARKGSANNMWKGGVTPKNRKERQSTEYYLWRSAVWAGDRFACRKCKVVGHNLIAHHILNFAEYPELRFAIDNGITLCKKCHTAFHKKYGYRHNNKEQIEDFLKSK